MLNIFITNIAIIWQRKVNNTSDLVTKRKPPAGIKTLQVYVVNHQKIKNFTILRFEGLQYKDYIEPKVNTYNALPNSAPTHSLDFSLKWTSLNAKTPLCLTLLQWLE